MADIKNNTETQELILKYYKLPGQLSKLHILTIGGGGKQEDWKNYYNYILHSALNTCIN